MIWIAAGVCGVIGVLKGFTKKIFVVASFVGTTLVCCHLIAVKILYNQSLFRIGNVISLFGMILFAVALLILGLNNTFPPIIKEGNKTYNLPHAISNMPTSAPSAADELRALKADFDAGKLSEEEFNAKRAELIKKL